MYIHWITPQSVAQHQVADLPTLLEREDGILWVDIPNCDQPASQMLEQVFGCHHLAIEDCRRHNLVPKIHAYPKHFFIILHSLEREVMERLRLPELDQFIGKHYLITIHTLPPGGEPCDPSLQETRSVLARLQSGRLHPQTSTELSYAIVSTMVRQMEAFLTTLRGRVSKLEQRFIAGGLKHPEKDLEEMFQLRHELLTVKTMATQSRELYSRAVNLAPRFLTAEGRGFMEDLLDQFSRIQSMCDGEKEFLQGVIDYYQTRITTKINIAMERLALITSLLLPITAVSSVYGMNIIVNNQTDFAQLILVLLLLFIFIVFTFWWARRHGWW